MTQKQQIRKAIVYENPYILWINGKRYSVMSYNKTFYMAHCKHGLTKYKKTRCEDLVFYMDYKNQFKYGLYEPLKHRIFDFVIDVLKERNEILGEYELPELETAGKFIYDIEGKVNEYRKHINLPYIEIHHQGGSWYNSSLRYTKTIYPAKKSEDKLEHTKWDVNNGDVVIKDKVLHNFNPNFYDNHRYPWSMPNEVKLPNGEDVYVDSEQSGRAWYIYKWKTLGEYYGKYNWNFGWNKRDTRVPINIEGEIIDAPVHYGYFRLKRKNWTKVREILSKMTRDISLLNLSKLRYHIYGKDWGDFKNLKKEVSRFVFKSVFLDEECQCERCRAYEAFVEAHPENKIPSIAGFGHDYHKSLHALEHGELPDSKEVIKECNCKGCKMYRNTKKSERYVENRFKKDLKELFDTNRYEYIIIDDWKVNPQIMPWELDQHTDIRSFKPNINHTDIQKIVEDKWSKIKLGDGRIRDNIGILHARLQEIPYENAEAHKEEYLQELFQTQMKPDCNCVLCKYLKDHNHKIKITTFMEIMIEPIPPENYPTGLIEKHFKTSSVYTWRAPSKPIFEFMDYFNKYILTGKICPCETCQSWAEKIKYRKYLPNEEVENPRCANPNCNNRIHNKQLIYDLSKMAKAVDYMQMDSQKIEIRTALCCSCYSDVMRKKRRRKMLYTLNPGQIVKVDGEKFTIKEKGGVKTVNDESLSELGARDCKIRLSQQLESKI